MKTQRTLIAACIAALFASSAVMAKDRWEYHEDRWDDTRSYGSINIDKDSVKSWGPWEEFVEPAAGAPSIAFLGAGSGDAYNPIPGIQSVIPPVIPPVTPKDEAVGYAVFQNNTYYYYYYGDGGESVHPATFAVRIPEKLDESATTAWRLTSLDDTVPHFAQSGELGNAGIWGNYFDFYRNDSDGYGGAYIAGSVPHSPIPLAVGTGELDGYYYFDGGEGGFARALESYTSGDESNYYQRTHGVYVVGIPTSATDMSALRANGIQATYDGYAFQGAQVHIEMNFGTAKWSGTWNGGADGTTVSTTYRPGYITGPVGFVVTNGTISGATFLATTANLSANDRGTTNTVTGMVQGSLYGKDAAALAGVADITKTRAPQQGPAVAAALSTGGGTQHYDQKRYVDLFVAIKNVNPPVDTSPR